MSGTGNENEEPNHRRSTRARKQREAYPCDFLDEEKDARPSNGASSGNASSNRPSETRLVKPPPSRWEHWRDKTLDNLDEFSTADGRDKLVWTYRRWDGTVHTQLVVSHLMREAEQTLVGEQDARDVQINYDCSGYRYRRRTQVPYHADLLPYYKYFAQGIQQHSDMESFAITNYHLPPSPWLGNSILPTLETTSISELVLSHCSLSGEDLASLANFLQGNTTLYSLDISHNTIESADTLKAIAKALNKKSSAITVVNLAHTTLGGGDNAALEKLLASLKKCEVLDIGHEDMDSEAVASIAKFVGKKNALTFFSLVGARLDKDNKKALEASLVKNKTIESLCLSSNGLALPGVLRNTKKAMKSLSRLTYLDLSFNSLPVQGAKALAKILEHADCSLETLILSNNRLTTKGANHILPALKANESLEELDLSGNWLNDAVAPAVVDLLQNNSTLLSLDLQGNKSLKGNAKTRYRYRHGHGYETIHPTQVERGKAAIVKGALFDTTSLQTIANSNHTCAVRLSGQNTSTSIKEETIRKINEMDVAEGVKIRYKVVLALTEVNKDLYDPRSFNDVPLELMPYLITLVQQEIGVGGFGRGLVAANKRDRSSSSWDYTTPGLRRHQRRKTICDPSLSNIYEVIMGWQSLPLLFVNGAGELPKKVAKKAAKKKTSRKRRRKFGEEDDDDDEPYIPKGARKHAKYVYNQETHRYDVIPAPVY